MYDRMNPNTDELIKRLEEYSKIDYGKEAYALSTAEAYTIVTLVNCLTNEIQQFKDDAANYHFNNGE